MFFHSESFSVKFTQKNCVTLRPKKRCFWAIGDVDTVTSLRPTSLTGPWALISMLGPQSVCEGLNMA